MMRRCFAVAAALAFASPAFAGAPGDAPVPTDPAPPFAVKIIPATLQPVVARQPLICHSSIETGSLIQRRKQCLTKSQWRYVEDVQDQQNRQLLDDQRSKQGCNGPDC
ncbi:hypothetical protein [Polymorphobacter megasporae]|uniref:hypothetical protein n=1 Tax=Glacieibacterium megasporae TaxID=2835787 RepID=UPI001C1E5B0A|nr:hypothetical protein [Polymorphobacter megasporae]UAJ10348.1 hypothetical protein KTC28_00825 [Polymorphobacter megasporae]